jgi:hypothetical protein
MITKEYTLNTGKKAAILILRISAAAVVSSIALFFLARNIVATTEKIVTARNEFALLTTQYGALDQSERDYETAKRVAEKLGAMLPTPDAVPVVEDFLQGIARKTNTTLVLSFDYSPHLSAAGTLSELGISLQIEGGEQSILTFLDLIENAPYLIAVRGISLQFNPSGQFTARMPAVVYLSQNL